MAYRRRILIVDESRSLQAMLAAALASNDYDLLQCATGGEALAIIEQQYIDFVCSGYFLKDMGGVDLCQRIRATTRYSQKPFVLLTSRNDAEALAEALPKGVTDIFYKTEIPKLVAFIKRFTEIHGSLEGNVLYVEDSASQRVVLKAQLEKMGLTVDAVGDGEAAWALFSTRPYDAVLTDIVLEGSMSGIGLVNRIRRESGDAGDTPVLALTAFDDKTRRVELFNLGISDYLLKPIVEEELRARLRGMLDLHRMTRAAHVRERRALEAAQAARGVAERAHAAKNQFLGSMSHELRTPLNAILGYAQLIGSLSELPEDVRAMAEEMQVAGNHLLVLIRDLIDLTRIESGNLALNFTAVDLQSMAAECSSVMQPIARQHGIALNVPATAFGGKTAWADAGRLRQVLLNLLSNAVKYNRPGGSVSMEVDTDADRVRIHVRDTGPGIAPELQQRLFTAFDRLGQDGGSVEGAGIGLVITQRIVDAMHGSIGFSSTVGVGSHFWVELPQGVHDTPTNAA